LPDYLRLTPGISRRISVGVGDGVPHHHQMFGAQEGRSPFAGGV
jgi:hypothetical protein